MNRVIEFSKNFFNGRFVLLAILVSTLGYVAGCEVTYYTVGGSINRYTSDELVLQLNNNELLPILPGQSTFVFNEKFRDNAKYDIAIVGQPRGEFCSFFPGSASGRIMGANVSARIDCVPRAGPLFSVSGSLLGLSGTGLILQNNGADDINVSATDQVFQFSTGLPVGANYNVTILAQPQNQTCKVSLNGGIILGSDIVNVYVTCVNNYVIRGTVEGLNSDALVLGNIDGSSLSLGKGATSFTFPAMADGSNYLISILGNPNGERCTFVPGTDGGAINGQIPPNVQIKCVPVSGPLFTIGGQIRGLKEGKSLTLSNAGQNLTKINTPFADPLAFEFAPGLPQGAYYHVSVVTQPAGQTCTVDANTSSGTVNLPETNQNITSVRVTCVDNFTVGGNISGLVGSGLALLNNNKDLYFVPAGVTNYVFPSSIANGSPYAVTIVGQPNNERCYFVAGSSGTINGANVSNVDIRCEALSGSLKAINVTISGLSSPNLVLQNNGSDDLFVQSGATSASFTRQWPVGSYYNVTIKTQPQFQECLVINGTGYVPVSPEIRVVCQ